VLDPAQGQDTGRLPESRVHLHPYDCNEGGNELVVFSGMLPDFLSSSPSSVYAADCLSLNGGRPKSSAVTEMSLAVELPPGQFNCHTVANDLLWARDAAGSLAASQGGLLTEWIQSESESMSITQLPNSPNSLSLSFCSTPEWGQSYACGACNKTCFSFGTVFIL